MPRTALAVALALLTALGCQASDSPASPRLAPPNQLGDAAPIDSLRAALGERAMIVTGHPEASRVGLAVLRDGGNAVDAAVAVGFALAVVLPDAGNVGGGGFLVLRRADGTATSWDFRERAPRAASRGMYLDPSGRPLPYRSTTGALAVGVPGTVAGLLAAHAASGRLPLARLIEPAIALAERHTLTPRTALLFNRYRDDFAQFESTAAHFVKPDGTAFEAGESFRQPDLADVLRRIRDRGRDGFYWGETARLLVAEMRRSGGLISAEDLASYEPVERPLLETTYRGYRVRTMGPPSSGGIALIQGLEAVEPRDLRALGFHSPAHVHLVAEALRRAFADRAHWLGDPAFVDVPAAGLIDSLYVARRMASFRPEHASASREVGHGTPPALGVESTETTHYSVVDADGNAVAVTTTLNDYFGSKLVVDGAGFFLNDEMDDFATAPGQPNLWGLVQGEANAVAPGKRMVSSMTPTVIDDPQGRLFMVAGSPGGARIISTVLEVVTNVIDFGFDAQRAVSEPRFHHQWLPDQLEYEAGLPEATLAALTERGWMLDRLDRFGAANVIVARYRPDGSVVYEGGADPRREDDDARGF